MSTNKSNARDKLILIALSPLFVLILLVALPFIIVHGIICRWERAALARRFRSEWHPRGTFILLVYSNSPNWQQYIEENILPKIGDIAVVLNWSKRSTWKEDNPWEAAFVEHWGGRREFNPMAILIPPVGKIRTIRFHKAFIHFKHGKTHLLQKAEKELLQFAAEMSEDQ